VLCYENKLQPTVDCCLLATVCLDQGSPNYGPRARCGPRSHFANDEKIIHSTYEKIVDLVEYNISRNKHIG